MPERRPVVSGAKFGRLTVIGQAPPRVRADGNLRFVVELACDCGTQSVVVLESVLKQGYTRSCGCLQTERLKLRPPAKTHGLTETAAYTVWSGMLARCLNPNNAGFHRYGGRGIAVSDRWRVFENFLADMGHPPNGLTIDRINNNGNYEPGNCRWASRADQAANTRNVRLVFVNGKHVPFSEACRRIGVNRTTVIKFAKKHGLDHQAAVDQYVATRP